MPSNYWLVKQEPETYSWDDLVREGKTSWTGVRNFQARNNLRGMRLNDLVLFYHSGANKEIVGIARVTHEAIPDPTAKEGDWSSIDLAPLKPLIQPIPLAKVKAEPACSSMALVRNSRLSVSPVSASQFQRLLKLGGTTL